MEIDIIIDSLTECLLDKNTVYIDSYGAAELIKRYFGKGT